MKDLYKSPAIVVEDLAKADVLCSSGTQKVYNDDAHVNAGGGLANTFADGGTLESLL